jgi:hypothetical protein
LAAVLAKQRFLGFGDSSPWAYVVNMGVAPIVAGLLLRRHWRARFSFYLFVSCQAIRGVRTHDIPLVVLAALGLAYFQRPSVSETYPRLEVQKVWARLLFLQMLRGRRPAAVPDQELTADPGAPRLRHGVLGGLIGGLVFAVIMLINGTLSDLGMMTLPLIGSLVGRPEPAIGFAVHMFNSLIIGASYVLFFGRIEKGMIDGMHFGALYGVIWWFLGPMTLMPLLLGLSVGSQWTLAGLLHTFPSLIGHLLYGSILGMTVGAFRDRSLPADPAERAAALRVRTRDPLTARLSRAGEPHEP